MYTVTTINSSPLNQHNSHSDMKETACKQFNDPLCKVGHENMFTKLREILYSDTNEQTLKNALAWKPQQKKFTIQNPRKFVEKVLPRYYRKSNKLASFERQIKLLELSRVARGVGCGNGIESFLNQRPHRLDRKLRSTRAKAKVGMLKERKFASDSCLRTVKPYTDSSQLQRCSQSGISLATLETPFLTITPPLPPPTPATTIRHVASLASDLNSNKNDRYNKFMMQNLVEDEISKSSLRMTLSHLF